MSVCLETESLKTWARMVAGAGDVQSKGFLFAFDSQILKNILVSTEKEGASLSAKQRLQRFRLSASPMARKLAGLMAAAPVSLPVVRLIQQTMLPQSSQVHVAEVFLGGMLKPLSDVNVNIEADNVQYDFFDGVRDLLLDSVPTSLSTEVVGNVSDYIAKRAGLSVDEFTAILTNALLPTNSSTNVVVRPFAKITAQVLRRLGGSYTQVAEKLEQFSESSSQADMYKVKQETPEFNYEYQIGGSLPPNAPTYVKQQADEDLYAGLKAGDFCYVLNSRQMGKSSLRVRTMQRLKAEGFACATVDITLIGTVDITPEQWYAGVIDTFVDVFKLYGDFDLDAWWLENSLLSPVQKFGKFIESILLVKVTKKIIIFIDEIDSLLGLNFKDDFFAAIRACYNQRVDKPEYKRLTFAMLGVATPSELIRDKQYTVFNIGRAIELNWFKIDETVPLERGLASIGNPKKIMQAILDWTGGQPFLTQKICLLLVKYNVIPTTGSEAAWVTELVHAEIIEDWEAKDEPEHLSTIRDRILGLSGEASRRLLKLYQNILQQGEIIADGSLECTQLRLSGLVVKRGETLKVGNRIYKAVFNQNWVAEQQQQFNLKTILILSANPLGTSRLRLDEEVREIENGLIAAKHRDQFKLVQKWAVRTRDFYRAILDHQPQIVHFCGHGTGVDGIVLEDETGQAALVGEEALSRMFELFAVKGVECVILNACYSEVQAQAISQHINYVVGTSAAIGDKVAIEFAVGFYDAVCSGRDYEFAFKVAYSLIRLAGIDEAYLPVIKKKSNVNDNIVNLWIHGWVKQNYNNLPTIELDWTDYFEIDSKPRRIANQATWDNVLKPSLIKARNQLQNQFTEGDSAPTVNIQGKFPLSAAFVIGSTFPDAQGYILQAEQRTMSRNNWWRSDQSPSDAKFKVVKEEGEIGEHLLFGIGITGNGLRDIQRLHQSPIDLDKFDSLVYIEPENGTGEQAVSSAGDAVALVIHAKELISQYRQKYNSSCIHLVLFAPLGFCLLLGQRLRTIGDVLIYEFIPGENYQPSVKLYI